MAAVTGWYWQCRQCGTANPAGAIVCRACNTPAAHTDVAPTPPVEPSVDTLPAGAAPSGSPVHVAPAAEANVRGRSYDLGSVDLTASAFATDAELAQRHGWIANSQVWEGTRLTVVYQYEASVTEGRLPTIVSDRSLRISAGVVVAGGVIVAIGALLPWLPPADAASSAAPGLLAGDGLIGLIIAGAIVTAGVGVRRRGRAWVTALLASLLALGFGLFELAYVSARVAGPEAAASSEVGIGIWVTLLGAVVSTIASVASRPAR